MERWPLGSTSETGVLALADTSASSLDEANLPCYELIRCVEHGTLNQRRQDLANPLHSLRRLKFKFFFHWLAASSVCIPIAVSLHGFLEMVDLTTDSTSSCLLASSHVSAWHQFDVLAEPPPGHQHEHYHSEYYHDNDGPHTWSYWLPWHHRPCAPDFKAHASRRSAMCEATLAILLQVFHIGARRHCVTAGWTISVFPFPTSIGKRAGIPGGQPTGLEVQGEGSTFTAHILVH